MGHGWWWWLLCQYCQYHAILCARVIDNCFFAAPIIEDVVTVVFFSIQINCSPQQSVAIAELTDSYEWSMLLLSLHTIHFFSAVLNSSVHLSIATPNVTPFVSLKFRAFRDSGNLACQKWLLSRSNFMFSRYLPPKFHTHFIVIVVPHSVQHASSISTCMHHLLPSLFHRHSSIH